MVEENDKAADHLQIKFIGNRKVPGSANDPLLTKGDWNWVMYMRPLTSDELDNIFTFARKWGEDVVALFNNHIVPKHFDRPEVFQLDDINTDDSAIIGITNHLIQRSVIGYVKEFFHKEIKDGSFFDEHELLDVFFPGVDDVRALIDFF